MASSPDIQEEEVIRGALCVELKTKACWDPGSLVCPGAPGTSWHLDGGCERKPAAELS